MLPCLLTALFALAFISISFIQAFVCALNVFKAVELLCLSVCVCCGGWCVCVCVHVKVNICTERKRCQALSIFDCRCRDLMNL